MSADVDATLPAELREQLRAELERQEAEERRSYVRALGASLRSGEEPVPLPGKTLIRQANDCAVIVAAALLILVFAIGLPVLPCLVVAAVGGAVGGAVYFKAPAVLDRFRYRRR